MMNVKKTYYLFLDDVRTPRSAFSCTGFQPFLNKDWIVVRNFTQFVEYIEKKWKELQEFPEFIAFDHDLDDEHYIVKGDDWKNHSSDEMGMAETGYDCAKWLVDFCINNDLKLPEWFCHSMNPAGKENINMLLTNFKKHQQNEKEVS